MTSRSNVPDLIPPVSTLGALEAKMGLPAVEVLLAERDELVRQVAPLRAKHGSFGTFDALRKIELATIGAVHRAKAVEADKKITEAALDELAHADWRYVKFISEGTQEKAEWVVIENKIQAINDTILRANAVARYLAAEAHL